MNKFQTLLADNSSATLKRRASSIATQAEIAQQSIVNELKQKQSELQLKLDSLTDFSPSTTDSLQPNCENWNPSEWAKNLQRTKWELHLVTEQLKLAQETYKEYFTNE